MTTHHIFIYGTLLKDISSPARKILDEYAEYISNATFRGKLYIIDWYPGVVESDHPDDIVHGEVYKIFNETYILNKLDRYEGCSPNVPMPHEFIRKEVTVTLQNGDKVPAWIYLYNQSVSGKDFIKSGNYLEFVR